MFISKLFQKLHHFKIKKSIKMQTICYVRSAHTYLTYYEYAHFFKNLYSIICAFNNFIYISNLNYLHILYMQFKIKN
jgi:hypothetical protein